MAAALRMPDMEQQVHGPMQAGLVFMFGLMSCLNHNCFRY